ncbi:hypothetical protein QQS21_009319 [Conoideocrella luteorostrata]|uniref:CFEM domain-containing protein n=1 Tax=Conoideocrella luteorostrata TaxID=1105319 RepID=A0AAJ0FQE7_9HYPO|nr:hypothetical protein QQS21_009319 [Conoideocrella luteorostrata]
MKSAVVAFSLIAAVAAQDIAALAQCGQTCANNMMAPDKAKELGCNASDLKCLCSNVNFIYGLRDCSHAICSTQDATKVVEYGMKVCQGAGVEVTGGHGGASQSGGAGSAQVTTLYSTATGTDGKVVTAPVATSTIVGGGGNGGNGGSAQVTTILSTLTGTDGKVITTPVATSTIEGGNGGAGGAHVTTIYSTATGTDGKVITTPVATSTISGTDGGSGGAAVTTYTTNGSQVVVTLSTQMSQPSGTETSGASQAPSGTESSTAGSAPTTTSNGAGSQSSSAPSSTSSGYAAHVTAAPGLLAAAGLAALFI